MAQLFWLFFCHIMKNIHQDDVDDNKVIKKSLRLLLIHVILENLLTCCKKRACIISAIDSCSLSRIADSIWQHHQSLCEPPAISFQCHCYEHFISVPTCLISICRAMKWKCLIVITSKITSFYISKLFLCKMKAVSS